MTLSEPIKYGVVVLALLCIGVMIIFFAVPADSDDNLVKPTVTPTKEISQTNPQTTHPTVSVTKTFVETVVQTQKPGAEVSQTSQAHTQTYEPTLIPTLVPTTLPTPIKTASADDPVLGTWKGSKSLFLLGNGDSTVTFRQDFTGHAFGTVTGLGQTMNYAEDFDWKSLGSGKYLGTYGEYSLDFSLEGDKLTMIANPKLMGIYDMDMDVVIELARVS